MTDGTERMTQRRVRALRGTAAAAVAVLFASTAHTLSGGDAPPLWLIVGVTILAAQLCIALVGRRRTLIGLGLAVAAAQLALHAAFAAVGAAAPAATRGPTLDGHEHVMPMLGVTAADPAAATMTLGHVLAALVTFVVLAWGEAVVAAIARGIRHVLARVPAHATTPPTTTPGLAPAPVHAPAPVFLACVTRRGPPARSALASFT